MINIRQSNVKKVKDRKNFVKITKKKVMYILKHFKMVVLEY